MIDDKERDELYRQSIEKVWSFLSDHGYSRNDYNSSIGELFFQEGIRFALEDVNKKLDEGIRFSKR